MIAYIGATNLFVMIHFIDVAYAMHDEFRSYTSGATTLKYGIACSMSSKQKLNTNSSIYAKLIGVSDYFLTLSYTKLFLEARGVALKRNIVY